MGFFFAGSGQVRVLGHPPGDVRAKNKSASCRKICLLQIPDCAQTSAPAPCIGRTEPGGIEAHIADLLQKVKLTGYENLKIGKYSRGMVQRIGIAQALLCDPQLVILDEPTSGSIRPAAAKCCNSRRAESPRQDRLPQLPHSARSGADLRSRGNHRSRQTGTHRTPGRHAGQRQPCRNCSRPRARCLSNRPPARVPR